MKEDSKDIYSQVTQRIIGDLEKGVRPWHQPWTGGDPGIPVRHNGTAYRGINIILLWLEALEQGFASPAWMTYKQARFEGGQVREGERGAKVVFSKPIQVAAPDGQDEKAERRIRLLRYYTVFNVEQIDGLPERFRPEPVEPLASEKRISIAEEFIKATGAVVRHGGGEACYSPSKDVIRMPAFKRFEDAESYYATLLHELMHWTRHKDRLNRDFGQKKQGDAAYATEELVAEIGAAFLCAGIGITPAIREDHAAYIGHWLTSLKEDNRAIFRAAEHAQKAVEFLKGLQPQQPAAQAVNQPNATKEPISKGTSEPAHPLMNDQAQPPARPERTKVHRVKSPQPTTVSG